MIKFTLSLIAVLVILAIICVGFAHGPLGFLLAGIVGYYGIMLLFYCLKTE